MSVHDRSAARKSRLGLYLPFGLVLIAAVVWTGFWLYARTEAQARMDATVRTLARAGYRITWQARSIGGYPFRLDVGLTNAEVREPSGWGFQAPRLEGEAYLYAPTHWMLAAPQGLTFLRPVGGPVTLKATNLRASLSQLGARPPSLSAQAVEVAFQPAAGALPFALQSAKKVELHLRAGPNDEGGLFLTVEDGRARPGTLLGRVAGDKPVQLAWNSTLSKMSAFDGADWAGAVRRWSEAGGLMSVRAGSQLTAGDALVTARGGTLGAGRDGRLRGRLDVALRQAPQALGAMAASGALPYNTAEAAGAVAAARESGDLAQAAITFEAGQTTLGPVALGPAPKVYTPR